MIHKNGQRTINRLSGWWVDATVSSNTAEVYARLFRLHIIANVEDLLGFLWTHSRFTNSNKGFGLQLLAE